MTVKKLSVSLDSEVAERVSLAAAREGVPLSAWLSKAAEQAANLADARAALAEYIVIYGEPDEATVAEAEAELEAVGFGQGESPEDAAARGAALARLYGEPLAETQHRRAS